LNDQSQHQAEVKTREAVGRETKLQATLDQQKPIIGKAGIEATRAIDTVRSGGSKDKVVSQLEQLQQTLSQALEPRAAPTTVPQPMLTPPSVIASRLDDYAMRVQRIGSQDPDRRQESYNRWHESERRALFGSSSPSDPPLTPEQKEKDDKGYKAEMLLFNAQDVAAYTAIDVDIRKALSDAYVALHFSESKKASERAIFNGLSDSAKKSIPTSPNGASPYEEDYARIAQYINGIREQLLKIVTPPATDPITSLSQLSNTALRDRVKAFASHLHGVSHRISEAEDDSDTLQRDEKKLTENNEPLPPKLVEQAAQKKDTLDALRKSVMQDDVPLAMAYRQELLGRLGSKAKVIEFPLASPDKSLDHFLAMSPGWLDGWADQLIALYL
jgi:hypothetical protein